MFLWDWISGCRRFVFPAQRTRVCCNQKTPVDRTAQRRHHRCSEQRHRADNLGPLGFSRKWKYAICLFPFEEQNTQTAVANQLHSTRVWRSLKLNRLTTYCDDYSQLVLGSLSHGYSGMRELSRGRRANRLASATTQSTFQKYLCAIVGISIINFKIWQFHEGTKIFYQTEVWEKACVSSE